MSKNVRLFLFVVLLGLMSAVTARAQLSASQLAADGWNCTPPIFNNVHCSAPTDPQLANVGKPGVRPDIYVLLNFSSDGSQFAGTEVVVRQDIYTGELCVTDLGVTGTEEPDTYYPVKLNGTLYYLCHHFNSATPEPPPYQGQQ